MRLDCETQIFYRMLQYLNHCERSMKATFTTLTLYRKPEKKKSKPVTFLLLCTAKNPAGTKYRVDSNIEGLFTKFVDEGKARIRIREPKHDVIISKAEATKLRQFLCLLRRVQRGDILDQSVFSDPPSKITRTREVLVVKSRHQYPSQGFPRALKELTIEGCSLVQLSSDVLALANLCVLNLKANQIQKLPTQLKNLPIKCLTVSENCIVELQPELFEGRLRSCLQSLDVSNNQLTVLPETLCSARKLAFLAARYNRLQKLPDGLGYLSDLWELDITSNALTFLPASMLKLKLKCVSIWSNPLTATAGQPMEHTTASRQVPWPLIELAARAVVAAGLELTAEDVPRSLLQLLRTATPCYGCQQPVFPATAASVILRVNPHKTVAPGGELMWAPTHDNSVPVRAHICSTKCLPQ
ncbi:leucine-rich repeat protein 1-like isoform X2 [Amblyomma americanum]